MPYKRRHTSPSPASPSGDTSLISTSHPITDRSSTFLALYSPTLPARTLQSDPRVASATHRIAAWRQPTAQRTLPYSSSAPTSSSTTTTGDGRTYVTGSDDDGERGGGRSLELVLQARQARGAVVVGRWYGGVLLGPVRFTHIAGVAREAIDGAMGAAAGAGVKRVKGAAEGAGGEEEGREEEEARRERERERLVRELPERDASAVVLRRLLAEKQGKTVDVAAEAEKKGPEYAGMPLATLRRQEACRDAMIAYLLKKIGEAEREAADEQKTGETEGEDPDSAKQAVNS